MAPSSAVECGLLDGDEGIETMYQEQAEENLSFV